MILLIYFYAFHGIYIVGANLFVCQDVLNGGISQEYTSITNKLEERIKALEEKVHELQNIVTQPAGGALHTTVTGIPRDCGEIYRSGDLTDGVYTISPDGRCPFTVYCDMTNGGWTLIQKRDNGKVSFYRSWDEYVAGFGDIAREHWLGLDKIHRLTKSGYQIYFDLENYDGSRDFAHYKSFMIHGSSALYRINVDKFGYNGSLDELLSYHDNMQFSTFDRDNDKSKVNCCEHRLDGGGWWYNNCYRLGNLNGVYGKKEEGGIGYWTSKSVPVKNVHIKVKARFDIC